MRTQRETDLEDEIELLRGQLLSSYARVDELEAALLENGKAFAAFGDHVRQAGCYALVNSEVDHE